MGAGPSTAATGRSPTTDSGSKGLRKGHRRRARRSPQLELTVEGPQLPSRQFRQAGIGGVDTADAADSSSEEASNDSGLRRPISLRKHQLLECPLLR